VGQQSRLSSNRVGFKEVKAKNKKTGAAFRPLSGGFGFGYIKKRSRSCLSSLVWQGLGLDIKNAAGAAFPTHFPGG